MSPSLSGAWDIPSVQKAHRSLTCGERPELTAIEVPKYSRDEVLVKIMFSGVCHTDFHAWKGQLPIEPKGQLVGGHEGTGIVVALGEDVKDISVGDRVGIQWINRDLRCV
ncbi:chaperonin 10-like protein [Aspergillus floccosus]